MKERILKCIHFFTFFFDVCYLYYVKYKLTFKMIQGNNQSNKIMYCLKFPCQYHQVIMKWKTSSDYMNEYGVIKPNETEREIPITITVSFFKNKAKLKKTFHVILMPMDSKSILVAEQKLLNFSYILGANTNPDNIIGMLELPIVGETGCKISWHSHNKKVLSDEGLINREKLDRPEVIQLDAVLQWNDIKIKKSFSLCVQPLRNSQQKVLFIVPHGDDEILMAVNEIRRHVLKDDRVYVCFMTNADTRGKEAALKRHKISLHALNYLGVDKANIYCLGYSNQWQGITHIYHADDSQLCFSKHGFTKTYGSNEILDYHSLLYGVPALYTRKNIKSDLSNLISTIHPDVLYVNDLDNHLDHRAYSLLFEEVMGELLIREKGNYHPEVYKAFIYTTYAYSKADFFKGTAVRDTLRPLKLPIKKHYLKSYSELENPAYRWKDRFRFCSLPENTTRCLDNNTAVTAFLFYNRMYSSIYSFLNADSIYWRRETANLLYNADVTVSSGNATYLYDFIIHDSKDITKRKLLFDASLWIPDKGDQDKQIHIVWKKPQRLKKMLLYQGVSVKYHIKQIDIYADGKLIEQVKQLKKGGKATEVPLDGIVCEQIDIKIVNTMSEAIGIGEIVLLKDTKANIAVDHRSERDIHKDFSYQLIYPFIEQRYWR